MELRDFYDDHTLDEADFWLTRIMPTTSQVTRERVVQVVGTWADMGIPTAPEPPTEQWVDRVAAEWAASVRQALAHDAFAFIDRAATAGLLNDEEAEDAALLAAAFARQRCSAVQETIWFLHRTNVVPGSWEALARLAIKPTLTAATRSAAQEWSP
ncbi:hypothetical protein ACWD46_25725 [Streptomyces sp. NPDC002486]